MIKHTAAAIRTSLFMGTYASLLSATACTTTQLSANKLGGNNIEQPVSGVSYWLPQHTYNVKLLRTLASCNVNGTNLEIEWTVKVETKMQAGVGESFVIDYTKMSGPFKTSSFALETWPNGTLKSIGVEAEDHSAEVITTVVKTGANIARLFLPVPGGATVAATACPTAVTARAAGADALKQQAKIVSDAVEALNPYRTAIDLEMLSDGDKKKVAAIVQTISAANVKLAALRKSDKQFEEQLSYSESRDFLPSAEKTTEVFAFLAEDEQDTSRLAEQKQWFEKVFAGTRFARQVDSNESLRTRLQLAAGANVTMTIAVSRRTGPASITEAPVTDLRGITYRDPMPVQMRLCQFPPFPNAAPPNLDQPPPTAAQIEATRKADIGLWRSKADDDCRKGALTVVMSSNDRIAQLGQLMVLPFKNKPNEKSSLSATFREDGSLEKASYKQLNATAQKFAQAASDAVDAALGYQKDRRAAEKARDDAAEAKAKAEKAELIAEANARREEVKLARADELAKLTFEKEKADLALVLDPESQAAKVRSARAAADLAAVKAEQELADFRAKQPSKP